MGAEFIPANSTLFTKPSRHAAIISCLPREAPQKRRDASARLRRLRFGLWLMGIGIFVATD
jgi:hypothetical protein